MPASHTATTPRSGRVRLAAVITEALAPWVVIVLLSLAMAGKATGFHPGWTVLWALVVATFSAGIPMTFITRGAKAGRYDTHHVNNREGRTVVLLVCFGSTAVGMAILLLGAAPWAMVVMTVAMLGVLVVTGVITVAARWKISMHTAVSAGGVAMLALLYGPWALPLLLLVAVVGWSRVVLRDHTAAQVAAGAAVGFVLSGGLFLWLL
ncbi:hypothetical protein SAMN05421810_11060 [Amycolatopsis arida]|uniref:Phosphatidic acid phosphatase type 2/haloperoxidase domain-containing protein n=1 Tax=Amycolatopsis arida TaxID=587909 RepID=A0A1I5ZQP2_9PSEU|nr:phosphatase PAP2 family protein [Amycolatopsis arida]TDX89293.1 hypothetical protein CLV69_11060 [Amycolatopsis arida]SFQ58804.1 hypothetical protein SAMN05421810_11060 [Amycolatopsis arida]